jgi:hypothetical protein
LLLTKAEASLFWRRGSEICWNCSPEPTSGVCHPNTPRRARCRRGSTHRLSRKEQGQMELAEAKGFRAHPCAPAGEHSGRFLAPETFRQSARVALAGPLPTSEFHVRNQRHWAAIWRVRGLTYESRPSPC